MAAGLSPFSLRPRHRLFLNSAAKSTASLFRRQHQLRFGRFSGHRIAASNSLGGAEPLAQNTVLQHERRRDESSVLLDVSGMMCGACVSRVKSILSSDDRIDSVVVNMLTETAAIRLKSGEVVGSAVNVAENLARRLTDCGFPTSSRNSEVGAAENVRKWKEMVEKKRRMLVKSRNRVAVAWTLVALCCGSHFAAELLFDGLRAFRKGSPNIAFIISAKKGIRTVLLSGDREEAVANVAKTVGIENEFVHSSMTPQKKSELISTLKAAGHRVAMIGDGINDAPSLASSDVGIALQLEAHENAASNATSILLLGNRISQLVDAMELAQATMSKVYQNLSWAIAYNVVAIPIAAGVLLPGFDFAMTPSLSGGLMALSSIFVVTNSLLLQFHGAKEAQKST